MKKFRKVIGLGVVFFLLGTITACQLQEQEMLQTEREETPPGQEQFQENKGELQPEEEEQSASGLEGQVTDQSFEAMLDGFGKVVSAPFEPVNYPSENPD